MNFGYVKDNSLLTDETDYNLMLSQLKVDKIYADRYGDTSALSDLIKYVRAGDCVVIKNVSDVSSSVGEFIEFVLKLHDASVSLVCSDQNIDTSDRSWLSILEILHNVKNNVNSNIYNAKPRLYEELDTYFLRVKNKELTVEDVCTKLKIGKSTYYRYWRKFHQKPVRERHPELFDQYEEKVALGEITVTDACKEMGIGITTYYNMRKQKSNSKQPD